MIDDPRSCEFREAFNAAFFNGFEAIAFVKELIDSRQILSHLFMRQWTFLWSGADKQQRLGREGQQEILRKDALRQDTGQGAFDAVAAEQWIVIGIRDDCCGNETRFKAAGDSDKRVARTVTGDPEPFGIDLWPRRQQIERA